MREAFTERVHCRAKIKAPVLNNNNTMNDGGRLSSGSECDDDDADCDGAAALPNGDSNVVALTR